MSYFSFLAWFLGPPVLGAILANRKLQAMGKALPPALRAWPAAPVVLGHLALAVLYTSPWDNYLVAERVWWYDPGLVSGLLIGYVPFEEYLFFALQSLLIGLWTLCVARLLPAPARAFRPSGAIRIGSAGLALLAWLCGALLLVLDRVEGAYLGLELVWALIPIAVQLGFGADILWHFRFHVASVLVPGAVYLSIVDALAIGSGVWTISPDHTLGVSIAGVLPLEEAVFFFLTTALVVFGVTLMIARPSHRRLGWHL